MRILTTKTRHASQSRCHSTWSLELDEDGLVGHVSPGDRSLLRRDVRQDAVDGLDAVALHQVGSKVEEFAAYQLLAHAAASTCRVYEEAAGWGIKHALISMYQQPGLNRACMYENVEPTEEL